MTLELITSNLTTGYDIGSNTELTILEGVVVSNGNLDVITSTTGDIFDIDINVLGTIVAGTRAIDLFDGAVTSVTEANIFIGETGTIIAEEIGMIFDDPDDVSIVNLGTIRATNDVIQFATLEGDVNIVNAGTMSSDEAVFFISSGSGTAYIDNSGLMTGDGDLNDEVIESNAQLVLLNSGTITGYNGFAIGTSSQDDVVRNTGTINGNVALESGDDVVNNLGLIFGDISVGFGADIVENFGTIFGEVELGDGDDVYRDRGDGMVAGLIKGEAGEDTLIGGSRDDDFDGGGSIDLIRGNGGSDDIIGGGGDDEIYGGDGNDTINGNANDDFIWAGAGNDLVYGGQDNDVLTGNAGDDDLFGDNGEDIIRGGDGDDMISGGRGLDILFGNAGADTFVYANVNDSVAGEADQIRDFAAGTDYLDLSALADDFVYRGQTGFTGSGDAEVRIAEFASGETRVYIDTDGDGSGDLQIRLLNSLGLTENDFLL